MNIGLRPPKFFFFFFLFGRVREREHAHKRVKETITLVLAKSGFAVLQIWRAALTCDSSCIYTGAEQGKHSGGDGTGTAGCTALWRVALTHTSTIQLQEFNSLPKHHRGELTFVSSLVRTWLILHLNLTSLPGSIPTTVGHVLLDSQRQSCLSPLLLGSPACD